MQVEMWSISGGVGAHPAKGVAFQPVSNALVLGFALAGSAGRRHRPFLCLHASRAGVLKVINQG